MKFTVNFGKDDNHEKEDKKVDISEKIDTVVDNNFYIVWFGMFAAGIACSYILQVRCIERGVYKGIMRAARNMR